MSPGDSLSKNWETYHFSHPNDVGFASSHPLTDGSIVEPWWLNYQAVRFKLFNTWCGSRLTKATTVDRNMRSNQSHEGSDNTQN